MDGTRSPSLIPPSTRRTIANRVFASFALTVLAFAVTVGFCVVAQRRAVDGSEELSRGYVPAALKLTQLRATHGTIATLVDGIPDERNPLSTKLLLQMLSSSRRARFAETRMALEELSRSGSEPELPLALLVDLAKVEAEVLEDSRGFESLFRAIDAQDKDEINRVLVGIGSIEHDVDGKLMGIADRLTTAMNALSQRAKQREQRSIWALIALAVVTLGIAVLVSLHIRRILAPLIRVTERARAVARGDRTPLELVPTDDEVGELSQAFETMVAAVARAEQKSLSNERFAAIGKMAAHVTHEIRNPLSSIGLNLELLDEEMSKAPGQSGEVVELTKSIAREVQRLEHLSEEYLRVARLPSPRLEADNLRDAVLSVIAFVRPEMDRAKCAIEVDLGKSLPPVLFDEAQIRQAFLNLLRNAREAMPQGGTIHVSARADGMSVSVSISDHGGGVPEEIRTRLFDPFFSTKGEGTGLGLAITRQIIDAHGGQIRCESEIGHGATFVLSLPIAPARASLPLSKGNSSPI